MGPVRIKYWGLVWITRGTYLLVTCIVGLVAVVALIWFWRLDWLPPFRWPWEPLPKHNVEGFAGVIVDHFWTIILVCLLAELIDIIGTLRAFARKEEEMRDQS